MVKSSLMDSFLLVVEDDRNMASLQRSILEKDGFIVMVASSGEECLRIISELALPDLMMVNCRLPDMPWMELVQGVKKRGCDIPFILLTASGDESIAVSALRLGAMDYVVNDIKNIMQLPLACREALRKFSLSRENARLRKQLKKVTAELMRANEQVEGVLREDLLTGVYNRGYLMNALLKECWRFQRYGTRVSFAIFGIDQLGKVSDSLGSVTGDIVLREFTSVMKGRLRKTDVVGRYRGGEIGVVFTETNVEQAVKVCEELSSLVAGRSFSGLQDQSTLSASAGLAYMKDMMNMGELIELADRSYYMARESESRRVVAMQMGEGF